MKLQNEFDFYIVYRDAIYNDIEVEYNPDLRVFLFYIDDFKIEISEFEWREKSEHHSVLNLAILKANKLKEISEQI